MPENSINLQQLKNVQKELNSLVEDVENGEVVIVDGSCANEIVFSTDTEPVPNNLSISLDYMKRIKQLPRCDVSETTRLGYPALNKKYDVNFGELSLHGMSMEEAVRRGVK